MTEPTEAEIEAAAIALFVFSGNTEEEWRNMVLLREHGKDGWRRLARAALTAAAQVRESEDESDVYACLEYAKLQKAEIERLRRLLVSIQVHPDTPKLFSAVIQNELARPAEKPSLMPIYSATEDQD